MKTFFMNKRIWIPALIILELVLLMLNAIRFNRDESYVYTQDDLLVAHKDPVTDKIEYESGFYADHTNRDGSYVVTKPQYFHKGIYSVTVDYNSNSDGNWRTCYATLDPIEDISPQKTADLVYSDHSAMPDQKNSLTMLNWVRYGSTFDFRMGPATDDTGDDIYVLINSVTITYMKGKTILNETLKLFFLLLLIDVVIYLLVINREKTLSFIKGKELAASVILFTVFFASYPLLGRGLYFGDDLFYHLRRIAFTADALLSGQFPVHILPNWDYGYGYAAGVGYGDMFLYPSAILMLFGFSLQFAYEFYIVLMNVITVCVSYYSFKKISGNDKAGLASAVIYSLMGFRLHSIYTGATIGEYGAYSFLPLVLLGIWGIYSKKDKQAYLKLAIGATLCISCHVLTPFIMAISIVCFCVFMIEKTLQKDIIVPLVKALLLIILLNLHFIVPLADYMLFQDMRGNTVRATMWKRGQEWLNLFTVIPDKSGDTAGFYGLGVAAIVILAIAAGFIICGRFKEKTWTYLRVYLISIVYIALCVNSTFYFFLYDKLPLVYKFFSNFQFPWRFLNMACIMTVFWFAVTMSKLMEEENKKLAGSIAMVTICAVCVLQSETYLGSVVRSGKLLTAYDPTYLQDPFYIEFSIKDADSDMTYYNQDMLVQSEGATAQITKRNGTTLYAQVDNPSAEPVTVEAPLWGYRHYAVRAAGMKLKPYTAADKRLAVDIPAGYSGLIKFYFREPWYWRLSEIVSLVILVLMIWYIKKQQNSPETI